jgi:ribose transport system substrate-binding protein
MFTGRGARVVGAVTVLALALPVGALAQSAVPSPAAPAASLATCEAAPKIAFSTINMQDVFFVDLTKGMQDVATAQGVEFAVNDPNGDVTKQIAAIEDYVNSGYDAIIVDAIDTNAVLPALRAAREAGVAIVSVDAVITDMTAIDAQVGADNGAVGKQVGDLAAAYIGDNLGGQAQVGVVTVLQSSIQLERTDGFTSAFEGMDGVEVVPPVDGKYSPDDALKAAEGLLTANPALKVAYATGQGTLLGLIAASDTQGRDVALFGWNLDDTIAQAIRDGKVLATVQQIPSDFGNKAMEAAINLSCGGTVPALVDVPVYIVTKDNIDQFAPAS